MTERFVRFTQDVDLVAEDQCQSHWYVTSTENVTPLMMLANFDREGLDGVIEEGVYQQCRQHNTSFSLMGGTCPKWKDIQGIKAKEGETMSLPSAQAEWLVQNGLADYPTHTVEEYEGVESTISRTNAILDSMGLPNVDSESMRTISVEGRRGGGHYARPRESKLASDLGLNPEDIADMKNWGSTKS